MMPKTTLRGWILASTVLLFAAGVPRWVQAAPIGFELATGCNGACLQGSIGTTQITNGLIFIRFIGDTANVYDYSVPNSPGAAWPNTDGQLILGGTAAFLIQDLISGVAVSGTFLPSAGIFLSTDREHCSMGLGSSGVPPTDPAFPGIPVYPEGLLGSGSYPTCAIAVVDLSQPPAGGPQYVPGWTISNAGFPAGYVAVGPPLPTTAGDMVLNEQGIISTTVTLFAPQGQTIAFTAPASLGVGSSTSLSATASSGLAVTFRTQTPLVCSVSGNTVTGIAAGTCTVAADQAGDIFDVSQFRDSLFVAAPEVVQSFAITNQKTPQKITFAPYPRFMGVEQRVALRATASSGLQVTLSVTTPRVCALTRRGLLGLSRGVCSVVATQNGNATFEAAPAVAATLRVIGDR